MSRFSKRSYVRWFLSDSQFFMITTVTFSVSPIKLFILFENLKLRFIVLCL